MEVSNSYDKLEQELDAALKETFDAREISLKLSKKLEENRLQINNYDEASMKRTIDFYEKRYREEQQERLRLNKQLAQLRKIEDDEHAQNDSKTMEELLNDTDGDSPIPINPMPINKNGSSMNNDNEQMSILQKYQSLLADHENLQEQHKQLNMKYHQRGTELTEKITEIIEMEEQIEQLQNENARLKVLRQK